MTHHQGDLDDDKYIAELLAEDARKSSLRYAAVGMSALLPKRYVAPDLIQAPLTRGKRSRENH